MRQLVFSIGGHKTTIALPDLSGRCLKKNTLVASGIYSRRFYFGDEMLTKQDLLNLNAVPNIKNVSLELYKEFSVDILMKRRFHYYFTDGSDIIVNFKEWGIYHMLSIQHIDYKIPKDDFFNRIDQGLTFKDFVVNSAIKDRFRKQKERITMFSCIYNTLRLGNAFYIPSGKVKNTNNVKVDYIIHRILDNDKGINLGIRYEEGAYVPLTILISKVSRPKLYLEDTNIKLVEKLNIMDEKNNIIETLSYVPVLGTYCEQTF